MIVYIDYTNIRHCRIFVNIGSLYMTRSSMIACLANQYQPNDVMLQIVCSGLRV